MATIVERLVGTGETYTTPALWEAGVNTEFGTNLVTADIVWRGLLKHEEFSTTSFTISGHTTDSEHYMELTAAPGASFIDNVNVLTNSLAYNAANGAAITGTAGINPAITVQTSSFARISKLQIRGVDRSGIQALVVSDDLDVNQCIIEGAHISLPTYRVLNGTIRNSLLVHRSNATSAMVDLQGTSSAYNCTFVVPTDFSPITNVFLGAGTPTGIAQNCALFGTTNIAPGGFTLNFSNCYSDSIVANTGIKYASYASQFESIVDATKDYRLLTASVLRNTGTTNSIRAGTDIKGTNRLQGYNYDVGCWEIIDSTSPPRSTNFKLIYDNIVDTALTITATSEAAGHLVSEVQNDFTINTWRSVNVATQTITITWSTLQHISALGLPFNNLCAPATVQVKLYTLAADTSPVLDTGVIVDSVTPDMAKGFSTIGGPGLYYGGGSYFSVFFTQHMAAKAEITLTSPCNPDGYIELSRLVLGKVWEPFTNIDRNVSITHTDLSSKVRTDSGDEIVNRGVLLKSLAVSFNSMQQVDKTELIKLSRNIGRIKPVFISAIPGGADSEVHQIYGKIKSNLNVSQYLPNMYKTSITVEEI